MYGKCGSHNLILGGDYRQFSSYVPVGCILSSGYSEPDSLDLTLGHSFVVRRTIWKIQIWRHCRFALWVEIFGFRGVVKPTFTSRNEVE